MQKEIRHVKAGQNDMKAYSMRENLLYDNEEILPNEKCVYVVKITICTHLGIDNGDRIEIVRAHRMPLSPMSRSPPSILVRL